MVKGITNISQPLDAAKVKAAPTATGVDIAKQFNEILQGAIDSHIEQKALTDTLTTQFVTGDLSDIHKLMIEAEKAAIGLELTVQVRNKVIEAYQEIMRMQL